MTTKTTKTKITTPVAGFNGDGPGTLKFKDGVAYTDNPAIIEYCRSRGYGIGSDEPGSQPLDESEKAALLEYMKLANEHTDEEYEDLSPEELDELDPVKVRELLAEPFDPRLLLEGGLVVVGTRLRDAAVDPKEGDFLAPTNAGDANPHGPLVNAPGVHGGGNVPLKPGPVHVGEPEAQNTAQTEHADKILTQGQPVEEVIPGWNSSEDPADVSDRGPLGLTDPASAAAQGEAFDPAQHNVDEVNAYLAEADDAEVARVLAAEEAAAKPRVGIVNGPHAQQG